MKMTNGLIFRDSTFKINEVNSKASMLNFLRSLNNSYYLSFAISKINKEVQLHASVGRFMQNNGMSDQLIKAEEDKLKNAMLAQNINYTKSEKDYLRILNRADANSRRIDVGILIGIPSGDRSSFFNDEIFNLINKMNCDVILLFNATPISDIMVENQISSVMQNRETNSMIGKIDPIYYTYANKCNVTLTRLAKGQTKGYWHIKPIIITISDNGSLEEINALGLAMKQALSNLSDSSFSRVSYKLFRHEIFNGYIADYSNTSMLNSEEFSQLIDFPKFFAKSSIATFEIPSKEKSRGEIELGVVKSRDKELYPFSIPKEEILKSILICGTVGIGKTNATHNLRSQLSKYKIPWVLFDPKRNGRDYFQVDKNVLIFRVGGDGLAFFNPLIPPKNIDPKSYVELLTNIIDEAYFLGQGAHTVVMDLIDSCYRAFGIYEGNNNYPTLLHLKEYFKYLKLKYSGWRERQWCESVGRFLEVSTFGDTGKVFLNHHSNIEKLLKKKVVLETDKLSKDNKKFFINSFLLYIRHMNLASQDREKLKLVLFFEEAHNYFTKRADGKETILEKALREFRELNTGCVIIDQIPSKLSRVTIANTNTKIIMNLPDHMDRDDIGRSLNLNEEQRNFLCNLSVGQAIVKRQTGFVSPFLVQIPLFTLNNGKELVKGQVTDKQIDMINNKIFRKLGIAKPESAEFSDLETPEGFNKATNELKEQYSKKKKGGKKKQHADQMKFLKVVNDNPSLNVVQIKKKVGFGGGKCQRIRDELEKKGLIKINNYNLERGGHEKRIEITNEGRKLLDLEIHPNRLGGADVKSAKHMLERKLQEEGYEVIQEHKIGKGRAVDLLAIKSGERVFIEIATGKSDEIANCKKILHAEHFITRIYIVCVNKKAKEIVLRKFKEATFQNPLVKVMLISDFLYRR